MTRDDEQCLKLGREIVRMVGDLNSAPAQDAAYGRRRFTYPGGEFHLFLCRDARLADTLEAAVTEVYDVQTLTPPSQLH